jgi:hypothetical protein
VAGPAREVQRTEVNGIPAFWADGPPPFTGMLLFRVGRSDESLASGGITHLVEHLAVFAVGPTRFQAGGMVDTTRTAFFASGTVDEVAGFLTDVTRALTSLPLDRLELEKQVLLTEAASWSPGAWANLMSLRFGAAAHGLMGYQEFGLRRVSKDEVSAWTQEYFTRDNAALWMTGPLPEGFGLDLPAGQRRPPVEPKPISELELPAYVREGRGGVAVSFMGTRSTALTTTLAIAAEAAHESLRLGAGMTYSVAGGYEPFTADLVHVTLGADCLDEQARAVQDGLLDLLDRLAAEGPGSDELERSVETGKRMITDPLSVASHLDSNAINELFGAPILSPDDLVRELDELTENAIATAVAGLLPTAMVLAPEHTAPPAGAYHRYGSWTDQPVAGRHFRAKRARPWRKLGEIVAGSEGISFVPMDDEVVTIRFDECMAVLRSGSLRFTLIDRDGSWIEIDKRNLNDAEILVGEIERRIPPDRFVPMDTDEKTVVDELAAVKLKRRWAVSDELALLPGHLAPGEKLLNLTEASRGMKAGLIALTDRRLMFLYTGLTGRRRDFLEFAFSDISSVEGRAGTFALAESRIVLVASGTTLKFKDIVPRERAPEIVDEIRSRMRANER